MTTRVLPLAEGVDYGSALALRPKAAITSATLLRGEAIVLLFACLIFVTSIVSPPGLMDDIDAAQAQMGRNILVTGDWVTMHLNGIADLEKPPLLYWLIALSFKIFGVHDWAARIPNSGAAILLSWLVARMSGRAMGARAGLYAGLSFATCTGLWLFTRVQVHDLILTLTLAFALWGVLRALEEDEAHGRGWALCAWAAVGVGLLEKGLIAAVFAVATVLCYLLFSGTLLRRFTWTRLSPGYGILVLMAVAAPWHILATLRNPPWFDFTMHPGPGQYHGFFWFYFFNEHILRAMNLRYPHDYNQVPRAIFWLQHLAWFFPWTAFLLRAFGLRYRGNDAAARLRLLALCWLGVVMLFFTVSTRQEYYSMPAYPAFAILIGSAMAESGSRSWKLCTRSMAVLAGVGFLVVAALLVASWPYPVTGDISQALATNSSAYTLALDHFGDLTIRSFAYLRLPLLIGAFAFLTGAAGGWLLRGQGSVFALAVMMLLLFQGARLALVAFEPYLGSLPLADALNHAPPGGLILDDAYFEVSTILFYTNRRALIWNGRFNNLEYGSYAPGAPKVFIDDAGFTKRWRSPQRWYVSSEDEKVKHLRELVGIGALHPLARAGGKTIYSNQ